jgi:hypothetical protein
MIAPLVEQFPPGNDQEANLPLDASEGLSPQVEAAADAPVDPPVEPETVDELRAAYARVRADNAAMAAKIAALEAPPVERWLPLKRGAAACGLPYEYVRRLAVARRIGARREGKRLYIDVCSVARHQQRLSAK